MNVKKVVAAIQQVDQLTCGGLIHWSGGRCAIGQLFFAAGKTDKEINLECYDNDYGDMFDGLLAREYGLTSNDEIVAIWSANDENFNSSYSGNCARRDHVVNWILENYEGE